MSYALHLANGQDSAPRVRTGAGISLQPAGPILARGGLRPDGGGEVTVQAGTMSVQVTPFAAWINSGTIAQGGYPYVLDQAATLQLDPGHPSQPRVDTVAVVLNDDAFDGSGETGVALVVLSGAPGGGAPALPDSTIPLRDITVPPRASSGTGGLSAGNIGADRREYTSGLGGVLNVPSIAVRNRLNLRPGQLVWRLDTGHLEVRRTSGDWRVLTADALQVQAGVASVRLSNDVTAAVSVRFQTPFAATPSVTVTAQHPAFDGYCSSRSITSAGVGVRQNAQNPVSTTITANWVAVEINS